MSDQEKISGIGRRDSNYTSRTETGRPSRAPDDKEGFRKVVERREERSGSKDDDDGEATLSGASHGIFDLTSKKGTESAAEQQALATPFELMAKKTKNAKEISLDAEGTADLSGLQTATKKEAGEEPIVKGRSFAQVHDDLAGLDQMRLAGPNSNAVGMDGEAVAATEPSLQTLVDQIVAKLYTVKAGDITDTVMTIKNPPVLAGSELVVTSFGTARGEFNIAFTNLTQEGKLLLDSQQANLLSALERHGYVAHIVVTTTEPYARTVETNPTQQQTSQEQRRNDQEQDKRGREQQGQQR